MQSWLLFVIIWIGSLFLLGSITYSKGYLNGFSKVHYEWTQEKLAYEESISKIKKEYSNKEKDYLDRQKNLVNQLKEERENHEEIIANLHESYSERMFEHEKRVRLYQRKAEERGASCRNLASYAGKLDRALTEGRRLVEEYTATLRQCERRVRAVGDQLLLERELCYE